MRDIHVRKFSHFSENGSGSKIGEDFVGKRKPIEQRSRCHFWKSEKLALRYTLCLYVATLFKEGHAPEGDFFVESSQ